MKVLWLILCVVLMGSCVPKEQVVLKSINIKEVKPGKDGPVLFADAFFFNPSSARMRLKSIDIDVMVNDKKAARVDQQLSSLIKAKSEFIVPLEVQLNLKDGLLDTILSLFGGKTYEVLFVGSMKVRVNGFPVKVPLNYKEQIKW